MDDNTRAVLEKIDAIRILGAGFRRVMIDPEHLNMSARAIRAQAAEIKRLQAESTANLRRAEEAEAKLPKPAWPPIETRESGAVSGIPDALMIQGHA